MSKPWDHIDETRLREMRESGMTVPQIADAINVPQRHVTARCRDLKIGASAKAPQGGSGPGVKGWEWDARKSEARFLSALRAAHPERCPA